MALCGSMKEFLGFHGTFCGTLLTTCKTTLIHSPEDYGNVKAAFIASILEIITAFVFRL
jgi:hypothetical protein